MKLSVALATFNEEKNLDPCLDSVKGLADEIVIVDGRSVDKTVELAQKYRAKVIITDNPPIFHINKQKALEACRGEWILQLDADERVSPKLAREIKKVIGMSKSEREDYQQSLSKRKLFQKHQRLLEKRDGRIGRKIGEYAGFFVPRLNNFWGKYLRFGGVYPDGVIRLVRRGRAYFPCQSVHEQIVIDGRVGWLENYLIHESNPNPEIYFQRNSQYINLIKDELNKNKVGKNPIQFFSYCLWQPIRWFFLTQIRHKGILDGWRGLAFSFFSALRFPRAYWRYLREGRKNV